jgi:glycosyltransferase involved in cell wall biosynthesis
MTIEPQNLHVIRCYERLPPLLGGMERHIQELTEAQRDLGVRVTEVFNRGQPTGESVQVSRGWKLDQIRPYALRSALFYAGALRHELQLDHTRFQVVHVHGDWPAFLFGTLFAKLIGADAVAATLHEWSRGPSALYRIGLKSCDPIFATGLREARLLAKITGKVARHLPSAPAEVFFTEPEAQFRPADVILAGTLTPRKNVALALDIASRRPEISIAIFGDGQDRGRLQALSREKALKNVRFYGSVEREVIHSAMSSSKLFLNTAFAEGSPTAALEAMACRLPVVLTPSNDYSDIVDQGLNGRVTAGWNADELVETIDEFLRDPQRLSHARAAARQTAERHRWKGKAQIVTQAMINALERHRAVC